MSGPSLAEACTAGGVWLGFVMTFVTVAIYGAGAVRFRGWKWACAAQVIAGLTAWLWLPWVAYGLCQLGTWNQGKINDLERQEQVLPPAEKVRPSRADAGPEGAG